MKLPKSGKMLFHHGNEEYLATARDFLAGDGRKSRVYMLVLDALEQYKEVWIGARC